MSLLRDRLERVHELYLIGPKLAAEIHGRNLYHARSLSSSRYANSCSSLDDLSVESVKDELVCTLHSFRDLGIRDRTPKRRAKGMVR